MIILILDVVKFCEIILSKALMHLNSGPFVLLHMGQIDEFFIQFEDKSYIHCGPWLWLRGKTKTKIFNSQKWLYLVTESASVMVHKRNMRRSHVAYASKRIVSLTMTWHIESKVQIGKLNTPESKIALTIEFYSYSPRCSLCKQHAISCLKCTKLWLTTQVMIGEWRFRKSGFL